MTAREKRIPPATINGIMWDVPVNICFGRTKEPVVWNEESGETADLIILIAVPLSEAGDTHLKILANLSRRLMHEEFRESLRSSTREQVYTILEEVLEG